LLQQKRVEHPSVREQVESREGPPTGELWENCVGSSSLKSPGVLVNCILGSVTSERIRSKVRFGLRRIEEKYGFDQAESDLRQLNLPDGGHIFVGAERPLPFRK